MANFIPQGMGWIPDLPDARDYSYRHETVLSLLEKLQRSSTKRRPDRVDLRSDADGEYFTPPEDQGPLNSSTAFAVLSLVEYFERRVRGCIFEGSRRFLYKVTRNHLHKQRRVTGDTGADLRTTLKTLVHFGVPPEEYWPYDTERFDEEPSQFVYNLARPFSGLRYFRVDEPNRDGAATWEAVESFLAAGFPIAFGFSVPASMTADADIRHRLDLDSIRGGQAAVAVGYQLHRFGRGQHAVQIRTSWGSQWGDNGNGWFPVRLIRKQLARDFWSILSNDWLDGAEICRPAVTFSSMRRGSL